MQGDKKINFGLVLQQRRTEPQFLKSPNSNPLKIPDRNLPFYNPFCFKNVFAEQNLRLMGSTICFLASLALCNVYQILTLCILKQTPDVFAASSLYDSKIYFKKSKH